MSFKRKIRYKPNVLFCEVFRSVEGPFHLMQNQNVNVNAYKLKQSHLLTFKVGFFHNICILCIARFVLLS